MSGKSHRILIVDDDPDNLTNLSDILSEKGYEIETACNGQIALAKIERAISDRRFDLCLLDFKMPGMDGVELIEQWQSRDPGLCAIMITAFAGDDGIQRALAAGTWKVLRKPVDMAQLLKMIDQAVSD